MMRYMGPIKEDEAITDIWRKYQSGKDHHTKLNLYRDTEKAHNFYNGEQWKGIESGGEELPSLNIIKPIGRYKTAIIAQNAMSIVYTSTTEDENTIKICGLLNKYAAQQWEKNKMDTLSWSVIKNAFIAGDHYVYFYVEQYGPLDKNIKINTKLIGKTSIYFGDEQNPVINEQPYIILAERKSVDEIRQIAKENKIKQELIDLIVSDEETTEQINYDAKDEVKTENGKCTSLVYLRKTEEGIAFSKSVKNVVYEPEQVIKGLQLYPICGLRWEESPNNARGLSGALTIIPNQIEINKLLARRSITVKRFAFPTLVYDGDKIANIADLDNIGANIQINDLAGNPINSVIQYLNPAPISTDAQNLQNELVSSTRELEGASDAVTGQIDPTKASGEAIKAARDQAAVNLNEQVAFYKQFIEDIALLWLKLWTVSLTDGTNSKPLDITIKDENEQVISESISYEELKNLDVNIKIDVSPIDPYSKLSQEIALERLLQSKYITFDEYVAALDETSSVPKAKLLNILNDRNKNIPPELLEALRQSPEAQQMAMMAIMQQQGGDINAMPAM